MSRKNVPLPAAVNFRYGEGKWWDAHIQSYACLRETLQGEGLHQHHLIPKSLLEHGPRKTQFMIDYIPSISLERREHLSSVHQALNVYLAAKGVWQVNLSGARLEAAIAFTRDFYRERGLLHFVEAIDEFLERVYAIVAR